MMYTPSFIYDGTAADLSTWQKSEKSNGNKTVAEWISPDETLVVRVTETVYPSFPVVEIVPELICSTADQTKIIENFRTLNIVLPLAKTRSECVVRAVHGARTNSIDFCARNFILTEHPEENFLSLASAHGHSSAVWMPWLGIDFSPYCGLDIAIGWSGAWRADFACTADTLNVQIGMVDSKFYMKESEHFRLPGVLLFKWEECSVMDFQTVIRNFMIEHKSPRDSQGKILKPRLPLTAGGGNHPAEYLIREIEYAAKHEYPFDTFWVDAGWYGPPHKPDMTTNCGDCWFKYAGDWQINTVCHPEGLRPAADAAKKHGMKFLLWFEPERATENAPVWAEHPEYFMNNETGSEFANEALRRLLNIGNADARKWIFDTVCKIIDETGVDIYRQDFNMDPLPIWRRREDPDRIGVNEIKHIMGVYAYLDALRERYPDMLLENCAGGGRRMDYEMVSRAHSYCRSDYYIPRKPPEDPLHDYQILMGQNALMNTMAYVPFQSGETNPVVMFNDYEIFSIAGTGSVFTPSDWNSRFPEDDSFTDEENKWLVKRFRQIARMRDILCGELYFLTDTKTDQRENIWTAYQAWNEEINAGFAAFFRRKDAQETVMIFALKNIDPDAVYRVEDFNGGESIVKGRELAKRTICLNTPRSVSVIFYSKL